MSDINQTEEQSIAINTKKGCVVSSGAGSGKTFVLSRRFLQHVFDGTPCDRILTMTFTRKATASMKQRIREVLQEKNLTEELSRFCNAHISTVDKFCHEIVRKDCFRYGLSDNFRILSEKEFDEALNRLADQIISESLNAESIKAENIFFQSNDSENENYKALIFLLNYKEPTEIKSILKELGKKTCLLKSVLPSQEKFLNYIQENIEKIRENLNCIISDFKENYSEYRQLESDIKKMEEILKNLSENVLVESQSFSFSRSFGSREIQTDVKERRYQIKALSEMYNDCLNTLQNRQYFKLLHSFFSKFEKLVNNYKISSGCICFEDAMQIALDILLTNKKIRTYYKNLFDYIMIDEFQDNNDNYRKLLYLLSEKKEKLSDTIPLPCDIESKKIFLVGDEKQSIYRFRGADVSVFKRLQKEISQIGGESLQLSTNFRSNAPLLNVFNTIFSKLMPQQTSKKYEAVFSSLRTGVDFSLQSKVILNVFLNGSENNTENNTESNTEKLDLADCTSSEAASLAKLIKTMVDTDNFLLPQKEGEVTKTRRPLYSDIAILLRKTGNQGKFEKALRIENIPYTSDISRDFSLEALFNDFYSLMNLAVYPSDKVCQKAVENGPFSSVLKNSFLKNDFPNNDFPNNDFSNVVKTILELSENKGIAAVIDYLWFDLGYRLFIISNPDNQVYTDHYLLLYKMATEYDENNLGLPAFLQYMRECFEENYSREEHRFFGEKTEGVKITTVHKSKGLEFPIVIIPEMQAENQNNNSSFFDSDDGLLYFSCTPKEGKLENLHKKLEKDDKDEQNKLELIRLFYVAVTRAEQHIVFSATPSVTIKMDFKKSDSFFSLFAEATGIKVEKNISENSNLVYRLTDCPSYLEVCQFERIEQKQTFLHSVSKRIVTSRIENWYEKAVKDNFDYSVDKIAVTEAVKFSEKEAECETECKADEKHVVKLCSLLSDSIIQSNNIQNEFGTYVHSIIENAIKGSYETPLLFVKSVIEESVIEDPEFSINLNKKQLDIVKKDALMLANAFFNSALYKNLCQKGCVFFAERGFEMYDDKLDKVLKGSIDLLAINSKEALVIDFKTDSEYYENKYEQQINSYKKAVQSFYPDLNVNTKVVYLRELLEKVRI